MPFAKFRMEDCKVFCRATSTPMFFGERDFLLRWRESTQVRAQGQLQKNGAVAENRERARREFPRMGLRCRARKMRRTTYVFDEKMCGPGTLIDSRGGICTGGAQDWNSWRISFQFRERSFTTEAQSHRGINFSSNRKARDLPQRTQRSTEEHRERLGFTGVVRTFRRVGNDF